MDDKARMKERLQFIMEVKEVLEQGDFELFIEAGLDPSIIEPDDEEWLRPLVEAYHKIGEEDVSSDNL